MAAAAEAEASPDLPVTLDSPLMRAARLSSASSSSGLFLGWERGEERKKKEDGDEKREGAKEGKLGRGERGRRRARRASFFRLNPSASFLSPQKKTTRS